MKKYFKFIFILLVFSFSLAGCIRKDEETYILRNASKNYKIDFVNKEDTKESVSGSIILKGSAYGVNLKHKSKNPYIIKDDGTLIIDNLPNENIEVFIEVVFTLDEKDIKITKEYPLTVLGKTERLNKRIAKTKRIIYLLQVNPTHKMYEMLEIEEKSYQEDSNEQTKRLKEEITYAKNTYHLFKKYEHFLKVPTESNLAILKEELNKLPSNEYKYQKDRYNSFINLILEKKPKTPIKLYQELQEIIKLSDIPQDKFQELKQLTETLKDFDTLYDNLLMIIKATDSYLEIKKTLKDEKVKDLKELFSLYDELVLLKNVVPQIGKGDSKTPANEKIEYHFNNNFILLSKKYDKKTFLKNLISSYKLIKNNETKEFFKKSFTNYESEKAYLDLFNLGLLFNDYIYVIENGNNKEKEENLIKSFRNLYNISEKDGLFYEYEKLNNKFLLLNKITDSKYLLIDVENQLINSNENIDYYLNLIEETWKFEYLFYYNDELLKLYKNHLFLHKLGKKLKLFKGKTDLKTINDIRKLNLELNNPNEENPYKKYESFNKVYQKGYYDILLENAKLIVKKGKENNKNYDITNSSAYLTALRDNTDLYKEYVNFEEDTYQIEKSIRRPDIRRKHITHIVIILAMLLFLISQGVAYDYAKKKGYDGIKNATIATIPIFGFCYFILKEQRTNATKGALKKVFSPKEIMIKMLIYLELILLMIIVLTPIVYIVGLSLSNIKTGIPNTIWPKQPNFEAYYHLFNETKYGTWFGNSFLIALVNMAIGTIIVTGAAYVFARYNFKGKKFGLMSLLVLQTFPSFMGLIAMYVLFSQFGLLGKPLALSILYIGGAIPGNVWLIKGFIDQIPKELDESAMLDGANKMQIFFRIILPLSVPILGFVAVSLFMSPWMDYMLPGYLLNIPAPNPGDGYDIQNQWTVAVGLYKFISDPGLINFSGFAAGAIIVGLPITILYVAFQKYLIEGIMSGATKG